MSNTEHHIDIIQLIRSSNVGCVLFKKAIQQFGSVMRALEALRDNPKVLGREVTLCTRDLAAKEYALGIKSNAQFIAYDMADFPILLTQIYECPPFVWAKGDISLVKKKSCAIVGARNASVGGRKIAFSLAKNLGLNDFVTISGLAAGIDTAAHQGAQASGTIAVLASGVNIVYPKENQDLYDDISNNGGLILSEAPVNAPPQARMFVKRNRIISALSLGCVIIEAAEKSGSLTTADFALEQNKEIFAVPGSPLDARAAGTNRLLRNGAHWVENSDDVIRVLQELVQYNTIHQPKASTEKKHPKQNFLEKKIILDDQEIKIEPLISAHLIHEERTIPISLAKKANPASNILDLLSTTPISCDDLVRLTGIESSDLLPMLSIMELEGDIHFQSGNMISKVIKKAS